MGLNPFRRKKQLVEELAGNNPAIFLSLGHRKKSKAGSHIVALRKAAGLFHHLKLWKYASLSRCSYTWLFTCFSQIFAKNLLLVVLANETKRHAAMWKRASFFTSEEEQKIATGQSKLV